MVNLGAVCPTTKFGQDNGAHYFKVAALDFRFTLNERNNIPACPAKMPTGESTRNVIQRSVEYPFDSQAGNAEKKTMLAKKADSQNIALSSIDSPDL